MGLFRQLFQLYKEFRSYGNPELERIKAGLENLASEVELLQKARELRRQNEEKLVIQQLRRSFEVFQDQNATLAHEKDKAMEVASEELDAKADAAAKQVYEERLMEILDTIDIDRYANGTPLAEAVKPGKQLPEALKAMLERRK